ncbi:MAG: hypothetical protein RIB63_02585, partial [Fulvivirga sp.]
MNKLQKLGGAAAITEAAIYLFAFIIFGAIINYPVAGADTSEILAHLADNQLLMTITNLIIYVLFGIVLSVLVLAIYERTKAQHITSRLAAVFGFIWVTIIIATGMTANIGLSSVITTGAENPDQAMTLWKMVNVMVEALGGGNEIVGALWVMLLSIAGLKSNAWSKPLSYLGMLVGVFGMCT